MGMQDNHAVQSYTQQYQSKLNVMRYEEKTIRPSVKLKTEEEKEEFHEKLSKAPKTKVNVPINPETLARNWNSSNTVQREIGQFNNGDPEMWLAMCEEWHMACTLRNGTTAQDINLFRQLLGPISSKHFRQIEERLEQTNAALPEDERQNNEALFKRAKNKLAQSVFPDHKNAVRNQKRYMQTLVILPGQTVEDFCTQVEQMSSHISHMPVQDAPVLAEPVTHTPQELVEIIDRAKKPVWEMEMQRQGKHYTDFETIEELKDHLNSLQAADLHSGLTDENISPNGEYRRKSTKKRKKNEGSSKDDKSTKKTKSK